MAKKSSQGRLLIPKDIWDICNLDNLASSDFGFFITKDSRVIITSISLGKKNKYEFLGLCNFDNKHRFYIPKNVDVYLGNGSDYYFSSYLDSKKIYIYKIDINLLQKRQDMQIQLLLSML